MPGVSSASFTLPANTQFIEFERTDADSSNWPKNTTRIVTDGEVNYMEMIPVEDDHTVKWREKIGNGIAIKLGYPKGKYCLKGWPAGYALFIHYKGKEEGPRTDPYLYGWKKARFRSSQEFIPHAVWLISDPTMNPANCGCKYCSGKTQKQLAEIMPPGVFTSSRSPGRGGNLYKRPKDKEKKRELLRDQVTRKRQPTREAKMYTAVQPKPVPIQYTKSPNLHSKEAMFVEREQDLRAVTARTTIIQHPLLEQDIFRALRDDAPQDEEQHPANSHLLALGGLNARVNNSVDRSTYKPNRRSMMEEALHSAIVDLENWKQQRMSEVEQDQDHDIESIYQTRHCTQSFTMSQNDNLSGLDVTHPFSVDPLGDFMDIDPSGVLQNFMNNTENFVFA